MKKLNPKIAVFGACLLMLGGLVGMLCGLVGSVKAAPPLKLLVFKGTVTDVPVALAGAFSVGDQILVKYRFDPDFLDTDPDPARGEYFGAIESFSVNVGSYHAVSPSGRIEVWDDFLNPVGFTFDRYLGAATGVDGFNGPLILPDGTEGISCQVLFLDGTLGAFSTDALPLVIDCSDFLDPDRRFSLNTNGPAGVLQVKGRIDICISQGP